MSFLDDIIDKAIASRVEARLNSLFEQKQADDAVNTPAPAPAPAAEKSGRPENLGNSDDVSRRLDLMAKQLELMQTTQAPQQPTKEESFEDIITTNFSHYFNCEVGKE